MWIFINIIRVHIIGKIGTGTIQGRYSKQKLNVFNLFKSRRENNSGLCEHQRGGMAFSE